MWDLLKGRRVLSFAEAFPGPYATMILSDLGADVTMIERPAGDPTRIYGGHFTALNRGKKSVCIDLKDPRGIAVVRRLIEDAEVVVEGFRPGVMARLGLSYEDCVATNPGLVWISVTGYGQTGPNRDLPGHDLSFQASSGLLDKIPGTASPAYPYGDLAGAMFAAFAVVGGLLEREMTGRGRWLDVSMTASLTSLLTPYLTSRWNREPEAPHPPVDPGYGIFVTADGRRIGVSIAREDHFWRRFCSAIGLDDLSGLTFPERSARLEEARGRVAETLGGLTAAEIESRLADADVPAALIIDWESLRDDETLLQREMIHCEAGRTFLSQPIVPVGDSGQCSFSGLVPALGEHGHEVLTGAGYSSEEVESLIRSGVLRIGESARSPISEAG